MRDNAFWRTFVERYEESRQEIVPYEPWWDEAVWNGLSELAEQLWDELGVVEPEQEED